MEHVEFHCFHGIKIPLDYIGRHEMAGNIDQQSTPGEAWLIVDLNAGKEVAVAIGVEELQERFEPAQCADDCWRSKHCLAASDVDAIAFVLADAGNVFPRPFTINNERRRLIVSR